MRHISILWKLFQSTIVNGDAHSIVVLVVGDQPLQSSENDLASDSKVTVGVTSSLSPHD